MSNMNHSIKKIKGTSEKALPLAIVIISLCLTAACQATPSKPVVIQKDNFEDLVKITAQPTNGEESQPTTSSAERTPTDKEHITWENEMVTDYPNGCSTKTAITVDAYADTQQKKASVFLVETKDYDIDFAKRAVDYFLGDEYYDGIYSKEDWLIKILPLKQVIQSGSKGSAETAEADVHSYEERYETAPESNSPGEITFNKEWYHPTLNEYINYMCVKGYPHNGAVSELYAGNGGKANTNFYYVVQDGKKVYMDFTIQYEYSGIPARGLATSYEDAKSIAEDAVCHLYGEEMAYVQTDLCNAIVIDKDFELDLRIQLNKTCPQCYVFTFSPVYGGLSQLYAPEAHNENSAQTGEGTVFEQKWDHEYSMKWPAHYVQVYVDDNGIVEFYEFSPAKIVEKVNDNVQMLTFDEIFEQFKKDIFYCSAWSAFGSLKEVDITIDNIEFGMIRVPVKDNPDTYYMIPAWQFAGSKREIGTSLYTESGKTFLVLNALDGSIIDTSYYISAKGTLEGTIGVEK